MRTTCLYFCTRLDVTLNVFHRSEKQGTLMRSHSKTENTGRTERPGMLGRDRKTKNKVFWKFRPDIGGEHGFARLTTSHGWKHRDERNTTTTTTTTTRNSRSVRNTKSHDDESSKASWKRDTIKDSRHSRQNRLRVKRSNVGLRGVTVNFRHVLRIERQSLHSVGYRWLSTIVATIPKNYDPIKVKE